MKTRKERILIALIVHSPNDTAKYWAKKKLEKLTNEPVSIKQIIEENDKN